MIVRSLLTTALILLPMVSSADEAVKNLNWINQINTVVAFEKELSFNFVFSKKVVSSNFLWNNLME